MGRQADLFASPRDLFDPVAAPVADEADRRELEAMARDEMAALLGRARGAARLPWADYTQATLAEMRFDGLARHVPADEGAALRAAFAAELDRLYALEEQRG
jgi:hypothetical protein